MNKSNIKSFCPTPSLAFVTKYKRPNWKNFRFAEGDNNRIISITVVEQEELSKITRDIYKRLKIHNWKNTEKLSLQMKNSWVQVKSFKQAISNIGNIENFRALKLEFSCLRNVSDNTAFRLSLENLGFMISKKLHNIKVLELVFDEISLSEGEEMTILGKILFRNLTHLQHLSLSFPRMKRFDKQALNKLGSAICRNLIQLKSFTLKIKPKKHYGIDQGVTFDDNSLNKLVAQDFILKTRKYLYNVKRLNLSLTWYRQKQDDSFESNFEEIVSKCYKERYDYDNEELYSLFDKDYKRQENLHEALQNLSSKEDSFFTSQIESQMGKHTHKREEFENFVDKITFEQTDYFKRFIREHLLLERKKVESIKKPRRKSLNKFEFLKRIKMLSLNA